MALTFGDVSAQQLAEILPIGVAILDYEYELVSVNSRFRELIPCSTENFFEGWSRSILADDYDRVATSFREAASSKQKLRREYHTRGPKWMWRVATMQPLDNVYLQYFGLNGDGGFIFTVADITLEKEAELSQRQIAREAQERKQQQERFVDMISHEIRNPLLLV